MIGGAVAGGVVGMLASSDNVWVLLGDLFEVFGFSGDDDDLCIGW